MRLLKLLVPPLIFIVPGLIWLQQTGDLSIYFYEQVPPGQFIYVLCKLVGMYALVCIAWQVLATLDARLGFTGIRWSGKIHRLFGISVILLCVTHLLLFAIAVSLRQGSPAWALFLPSFKDFYHTHLSFGLIGLWILFAVAYAGIVRRRTGGGRAKGLHKAYWLSLGLIYFHALAVGSESQSNIGLVFYALLGLLMIAFGLVWFGKTIKVKQGLST